ncbi:unnamed protein product [Caenorhabditis angaria]|uniref:Nematode cuticle collagen N-terminal domain-containing protein n=1 Tax=Caenorhabditis angaria TaxID=860376 RepID=A0A9P1J2Z4_9PELO|nr:unnamed protein product [Caenorhabditis angaria]
MIFQKLLFVLLLVNCATSQDELFQTTTQTTKDSTTNVGKILTLIGICVGIVGGLFAIIFGIFAFTKYYCCTTFQDSIEDPSNQTTITRTSTNPPAPDGPTVA